MAQYYVAAGFVSDGYFQTGLTIDWASKVIFVPKFYLTHVSGTSYQLDTNKFRNDLKDIEDNTDGIVYPDTHRHNTEVVLSGITYARVIEIINGYTVTFEDGLYSVNLVGSNNNIPDVLNLNQVSVRAANSAGLVTINTSGGVGTATEVANAVWNAQLTNYITDGSTGKKLGNISSPTALEIADAVRVELGPELGHILTLQNGMTTTQATMLLEIYRLYGLDPSKPLIVTDTSRSAGPEIVQNISSNASGTQVNRV